MSAPPVIAEVTRTDVGGGLQVVESQHRGHLVVVGPDGGVVAAIGDPDRPTFARSAAKPFQATACLELLEVAGPHLDPDEVAIAWASHRGEPIHLDAVRKLLGRSGTPPDALTCPPTVGEHDPGARPIRLTSDCSGKHALFALAAQQQGTPRERLLDPEGPLQRVVLEVLEDVLGPPTALGVDGCGAPAVAVPLRRLAAGFALAATADRFRRVREAGFAHPRLVGGAGRLESALLAAGVFAKIGAEGVFAAGWAAPDGPPRGLAVKAEDGAARAVTVATLAVLASVGVADPHLWAADPILGGGRRVGEVRPSQAVTALLA